jgi:hypothetical protein
VTQDDPNPTDDGPVLDAPGWHAIDVALIALYGAAPPHQFTSRRAYDVDSPSPLPAVTVWPTPAPVAWHFVGYGLSELFEKTSDDPAHSGVGFELTMLVATDDAERPPMWPLEAIQSLGRHVLRTREGFDSGHCIETGEVVPGRPELFAGFCCVPDPRLGRVTTPFGDLLFLRLVAVTRGELDALAELRRDDRVRCLAELDPTATTDPRRADWSLDAEKLKVLRRFRLGLKL